MTKAVKTNLGDVVNVIALLTEEERAIIMAYTQGMVQAKELCQRNTKESEEKTKKEDEKKNG